MMRIWIEVRGQIPLHSTLLSRRSLFPFRAGQIEKRADYVQRQREHDRGALVPRDARERLQDLGLALARPDKRVLVVTGDGELLMNLGALAAIAVIDPPNLAILCVDNGHYGETGWQKSHTSLGTDLEKIAIGAGIKRTCTVAAEADIPEGARLLREGNGTSFVLLRVKPTDPAEFKRNFDASLCRDRFRAALHRS